MPLPNWSMREIDWVHYKLRCGGRKPKRARMRAKKIKAMAEILIWLEQRGEITIPEGITPEVSSV